MFLGDLQPRSLKGFLCFKGLCVYRNWFKTPTSDKGHTGDDWGVLGFSTEETKTQSWNRQCLLNTEDFKQLTQSCFRCVLGSAYYTFKIRDLWKEPKSLFYGCNKWAHHGKYVIYSSSQRGTHCIFQIKVAFSFYLRFIRWNLCF